MPRPSLIRHVLVSASLGLLVASTLVHHVAGAPRQRDWAAIDAKIHKLMLNGANQHAIDAMLARDGIFRVDDGAEPGIVPMASGASNVTLFQPTVYWDDRFERYNASARFRWNTNCSGYSSCIQLDCVLGACIGPVGGPDGFGIRFNRAFDEIKTSFYTYDKKKQFTFTNPEAMESNGSSFTEQDSYHITDGYSWSEGVINWFFNKVNCPHGTVVKLYSRLDHTWDNTSITGFGIGLNGFNVSWNTSSAHWLATNASPTNFTC